MLSSVAGYVNEHFFAHDIFHYTTEHHIVCFIWQTPKHSQWDSFKWYWKWVSLVGILCL